MKSHMDTNTLFVSLVLRESLEIRLAICVNTFSVKLTMHNVSLIVNFTTDPDAYTGLRYVPKNIDLLNEVAAEIPTLWREMGLELGLAHPHLDCIETEQNRKQIRCFEEVLNSWRKQQTAPYTWETIIQALQKKAVGQYELAQILKKKFAKLR